MNGMKTVDMEEVREKSVPTLVLGLIPCQNRYFLDIVWPVILPSLQKLADLSQGEWDVYRVWKEVFSGTMQMLVGYMEMGTAPVPQEKFQEYFIEKLRTPEKDYAGFMTFRLLDKSLEIFASAIEPRFRATNVMSLALEYIEKQAKNLGAPYIQATTHLDENGVLCTPQGYMERKGYQVVCTVYRKKL